MKALALKEDWSPEAYIADDKDYLFLTLGMMFPHHLLDSITSSLLDISDVDALKPIADTTVRIYWESYGNMLAEKVTKFHEQFLQEIDQKHEEEKQLSPLRHKEKVLEPKIQQARERGRTAATSGKRKVREKIGQHPKPISVRKLRIKISSARNADTRQTIDNVASQGPTDAAMPDSPKRVKQKDTVRQKRGNCLVPREEANT
jgi:hypothetical protein